MKQFAHLATQHVLRHGRRQLDSMLTSTLILTPDALGVSESYVIATTRLDGALKGRSQISSLGVTLSF
jgi:hypothetical protein